MKIKKTKFKGLIILKGVKHQDKRILKRVSLERLIKKNLSFKYYLYQKNVLRGLHFQVKNPKVK